MLRTDIKYVDNMGRFTMAGVQAIEAERAALVARLTIAENKIAAAAAIANATGGATIDAEARTQLAGIKAALT